MKVSNQGIQFIKSWEKFSPIAYKPTPTDKWTIGYGFTSINGKDVEPSDTITQDKADQTFSGIMDMLSARMLSHINPNYSNKISQNQLDAAISLCYNIGWGAFFRSNTGGTFLQGRDIADRFTKFDEQDGQVLQGLLNRRLAEQEIYQKGIYNDHR